MSHKDFNVAKKLFTSLPNLWNCWQILINILLSAIFQNFAGTIEDQDFMLEESHNGNIYISLISFFVTIRLFKQSSWKFYIIPYLNDFYKLIWTQSITFVSGVAEVTEKSIISSSCGSAFGIMVIIVGNGHSDTSSKPGRVCLHFT